MREWYVAVVGIAIVIGLLAYASESVQQPTTESSQNTGQQAEPNKPSAGQSQGSSTQQGAQAQASRQSAPQTPQAAASGSASAPAANQGSGTQQKPAATSGQQAQSSAPNPPPASPSPAPSGTGAGSSNPAGAAKQGAQTSPEQSDAHAHAANEAAGAAQPRQGAATAQPQPTAVSSSQIASGRQVYRKCQACHSLDPGRNLVGPSLAGIIGRKSGTEAGFNYSPAMKQANITWDVDTLGAYLADPQKVVPGNRMPFPGLKSENERKDVIAFLVASSAPPSQAAAANASQSKTAAPVQGQAATQQAQNQPAQPAQPAPSSTQQAQQGSPSATPPTPHAMPDMPDVKYTLKSGIAEGRMVYIGVGGTIDGKANPVLSAAVGQIVQITLINGEGAEHDVVFPDQNARSSRVTGKGASTTIAFQVGTPGDFTYFCSVPGHRLAGMEGQFIVTPRPPAQTVAEADISRDPADLPPPIGKREPQTVRVDLITEEIEGRLAQGTTFGYWTFNGKVPGPFVRVRVGDTVDVHLKNSPNSTMIHSVDFHAAIGPGGGATVLQVDPGQEKSMSFKAMVPGLYVYHCATPMVAEHIANGMYGLILVEPEGGLPPVDREFYVMQGEIYTDAPFGQHGSQEFSVQKLLDEHPEYFVFNGSVGAITRLHPLHAKVGETVRLFFGVGGPNFTSSFHVIGEIFDKVYQLGGLTTAPVQGVQTVSVPAGGAVITEFKTQVPGSYSLVDHALARAERGLAGTLVVEGAENPDIYNRKGATPTEHTQ